MLFPPEPLHAELLSAAPPGFPPGAALPAQIRRYLGARFELCEHEETSGGRRLRILGVRDVDRLTDAVQPRAFAVDERFPYWAELWTSARVLADEVHRLPGLEGTRVLELGCGLGLVGAAAASAGAVVTMTDHEEEALLFARWSVLTSLAPAAASRVTLRLLDWRFPPPLDPFPIIVGADLLYERRLLQPLLACLTLLLAPGGSALLADPARRPAGEFLDAARARGFTITTRTVTVPPGRVHLHTVTRP